jgi:hypothetical protein
MVAITVGSAVLLVAVGIPLSAAIKDTLAERRFMDLQTRLTMSRKPISVTQESGHIVYSCTPRNGFLYTSPSREELQDVCAD